MYNIETLAKLAGLTRRTIRYYVQKGLLEPPEGGGRGSYYTDAHLEQLQKTQKWSEQGVPLIHMKARVEGREGQVQIDQHRGRLHVLGHGPGEVVGQGRGADAALGADKRNLPPDEGRRWVGIERADRADHLQRAQRLGQIFADPPAYQLAIEGDVVGLAHDHFRSQPYPHLLPRKTRQNLLQLAVLAQATQIY